MAIWAAEIFHINLFSSKDSHAIACHIAVVLLLQSYAAFNSVLICLLSGIKRNP